MRRLSRLACLAAVLIPAALIVAMPDGARAQSTGFSEAQRAEIVAILRQALTSDPTILRDAVATLRASEEQTQADAAKGAIGKERAALLDNPADPTEGAARGDMSLVVFYDPRCPYCRRMEPTLAALMAADPKLRIVFKDIPILGPASKLESRALLAAQKQGGYSKLRAALMKARPDADDALIRAEAQRVGLNVDRLFADMKDPAIEARLAANIELARRLGIQGTPAMVAGNEMIDGAVELPELVAAIAKARRG